MYDFLIAPFAEFEFMRRAFAGVLALALGAGPIGVFLMLRRMSLVGDAMAHAILPGAAVGFLVSGLNLFAMTAGGLIAGFVVAFLTGFVARMTELKEDAALATFYLLSLALGVTIVSLKGTNIDLLHVLFGSVLALDDQTLVLIAGNATLTLIVLALIYRPLVIECVDPGFMRSVSRAGGSAHLAFLALVVVNLVSGFHALGTLLAVGIMMLPAATGRFWARDITLMIMLACDSGVVSGYAGLLISFHTGVPSGPAIILVAGAIYVLSLLFGHVGGLVRQAMPRRHLEAEARPRPLLWQAMIARRCMLAAAACSPRLAAAQPAAAQEKLKVLATFSILGDFVKNVGGDRVNVSTLVGPNSDAHVYAPAPADAKRVADARVVITNGLGFEGWMSRLVKASGSKAAVVVATKGVKERKAAGGHGHGHGGADPHAWQSVANVKIYVANIRDALIAADPAGKAAYDANAGGLSGRARRARPGGRGRGRRHSGRSPPDHLHPRRLRLFPAGLRRAVHRPARGIHRSRGVCPRCRAHHHPGEEAEDSRGFPRERHQSAADGADRPGNRRPHRRQALFRRAHGGKWRGADLYRADAAQPEDAERRADVVTSP